jgi:hypothetical protein
VYALQHIYVVNLIILADRMRGNGIAVPLKYPLMDLKEEREDDDKVIGGRRGGRGHATVEL